MPQSIVPKKSVVASKVPLSTDLVDGEICINLTDAIIYAKHTDGSIVNLTGALELHTHTTSQITDIGTSATHNVASTGDAAASEVVKGDDTRLSDARAPTAHSHPWSEVTLKPATATRWPTFAEVTSKPSTYPPDAHNHDADYLGIGAKASDSDKLDGQHASAFAAASHGHAIGDVTGLQSSLNSKLESSDVSNHVTGNGSVTTVVSMSQSSYDAIGTPDPNTLYVIV